MLQLNVILLISALFALCNSSAILDDKKCALGDDECKKVLFKIVLDKLADHGLPELNVPKLDPYVFKDQSFDAAGLITVTMKEGEAKGLKNCYANDFKSDLENLRLAVDFVCEQFSIGGTYKLESTPALLLVIGGIDIHGEGKGGVDFEKVHLNFDFAFEVKKLDDGELHLLIKPDESTYDFEVTGKVELHADNVFVGKQEISAVLVNIVNENWEFIVKTLGRPVADKALQVFYEHLLKFFSSVPVKEFITGDLTQYVKS